MKKNKFTKRITLLNGGRGPYLEYLRNLTPQSILLTFTILVLAQLDSSFSVNNFIKLMLTLVLFGAFCLAVYANSTLFYEKCFDELKVWMKSQEDALFESGVRKFRLLGKMITLIWSERRIEIIESLVALVFLQATLAIVIISATLSATATYRATHVEKLTNNSSQSLKIQNPQSSVIVPTRKTAGAP